MAGVFTSFVGRTAELDAIDDALDGLAAGRAGALAIVGEPGIGKTRLLAELAERAEERRLLVLQGTASELERDSPFLVFVEALDDYVRSLDPLLFEPLGDELAAELAQVLPGLPRSAAAGPSPAAATQERYRIHRAVTLGLERLAAYRPLVLVLDDVHWADSGSFELLTALLRKPPAQPVLIACALRPRLVPEQVAAALQRAERSGALTRIGLGALTLEEAHELLDDAESAEALYAESGGNPFYLEQLARAPGRRALASGGEAWLGGIAVPAAVAAALDEELHRLDPATRMVLQAAAVAGDPFDPELAAAAAAVPEETAMAALDDLLDADLVRPTDVPRRFRFRHPLVRRAVYESAPGGWRLSAHERCAEMLAARGAAIAWRAYHVEASAKDGDAAAVAVLREAGEAAAYRAPATAARWFEGALRLQSSAAPVEERVELLLARATSLAATGLYAESHQALVDGIRIVPRDMTALRVRLIQECASVENQLGRYGEARARLERAVAGLDDGSPEAVGLMIELAISAVLEGEFDAMDRWAGRALAACGPGHAPVLRATALAVQAAGAAMVGGRARGQAMRDEAARLVDGLSDDELAGGLDALAHLSLAETYLDEFEASTRHAERALAIIRATGQGDLLPLVTAMLGSDLWMAGRMADSAEVLDGSLEAARVVGDVHGLVWMLFNRSYTAFAAGDVDLALALANESWELAQSIDSGSVAGHAGSALAIVLLETGDPARAAELYVSCCGGEELRKIGGAWRARNLEVLTRCFLGAGKRAEAGRAAAAARACAATIDLPLAHAMADLAQAAVEIEDGEPASAGRRAVEAVSTLEGIGDAFDAARARAIAGRALGLAGEADEAAAQLEQAAAAFASFGSARYQAQAEQELRKLGHRVYRRSAGGTADGGVAALTERELQLARLVVDRKTNPEIAAELFLSQKTVETHLRNIFRKVGVANRVELARAVEHADRAAQNPA